MVAVGYALLYQRQKTRQETRWEFSDMGATMQGKVVEEMSVHISAVSLASST